MCEAFQSSRAGSLFKSFVIYLPFMAKPEVVTQRHISLLEVFPTPYEVSVIFSTICYGCYLASTSFDERRRTKTARCQIDNDQKIVEIEFENIKLNFTSRYKRVILFLTYQLLVYVFYQSILYCNKLFSFTHSGDDGPRTKVHVHAAWASLL